jgi:hypothetical protein
MKFVPAFVVILFVAVSPELFAQAKDGGSSQEKNFPTTLQPVNPVKYYGPRKQKKKKKSAPVTYDAQSEYNDRIEKTWREREKRERSLEKSEASDQMQPPYFGHKKAPKIRPIGKRKYCKICGIRH